MELIHDCHNSWYTIIKQNGQNQEQKRFRHLLMNVRDAIPIVNDWKLLIIRTDYSLDISKKE